MLVYFRKLLQQRLSNVSIALIIWKFNTSFNNAENYKKIENS